ncbi:ComEC/Rec2 family competence protein [Flavobacterium pallidum]|uniref:Competence protein ComEC n=1 Tax=Flavobacterium pallidum TaxID=2172098 RepID=A0A2S1SGE9_9FLAO|nr:ComEC/Rec2 family competence protein [Flavobacterium pallidum]AWI25465.1 competence protein ComEC [Flavobacterium pallidum]
MKALKFPLTRITIFFVLGIICGNYFKPNFYSVLFTVLLSFTLCILAFVYLRRQLTQKMPFGVSLYCLSFMIGLFTYTAHHYIRENHYTRLTSDKEGQCLFKLTINEALKSNRYCERYIATVHSLEGKPCTGLILVNVKKQIPRKNIIAGTQILAFGQIMKHRPPQNPNQFDYGKYLSNKSIEAQAYVNPEDIKVIDTLKNMSYHAAAFRERIIRNLEKSHFEKENLAVVTALILGQQQDISKDTIQDYQYAGAIHILSVSGLHVGYIMLFINFMLLRLPKNRKGNTIRLVAVLTSLWAFSFIAGLSPSIVRSATMFSFMAVGMYLKRETYIFHTLLVSLLLILMVSPNFLFDVGFQLSYISLFFILWLQPYFSTLWMPKLKIIKYFWDIVTVSMAAQIGAFPLSIYYFHQFPGLFFITNIIILPGLGIIMAYGAFVMVFASFGTVPDYLSKSLEFLIRLLNQTIGKIASFEQFIIKDIPLNALMMATLYLFILTLFIWAMKPSYRKCICMTLCLLVFQGTLVFNKWENEKTDEIIVFKSKNTSLITKRHGNQINVYCDDSLCKSIFQNQNLTAYRVANFSNIKNVSAMQNLLYLNRTIFVSDSSGIYPENIRADVLLMTHSPKINFERMLMQLKPNTVIADASNFRSYTKLWEATCQKQKIPFHAIAEKGYFKLE